LQAYALLKKQAGSLFLTDWNDAEERTYKDVLSAYDAIIKRLERNERRV
jgi:hypothetical protein